mmetsp:Transcript_30898/g.62340  ORF Transcript_30898/g.62340 Transcript_30898/m.62340 type:complete len:292 (+) Transcript_30898:66-941(+)
MFMGSWPPCAFRLITACRSRQDNMTRLPPPSWSTEPSSLPSILLSSVQLPSESPFSRRSRCSRLGPLGLFHRRTSARHPRSWRPFASTLRRLSPQDSTPWRRCASASPPAGPRLLALRSSPSSTPLAASTPQSSAAFRPAMRLRDNVRRSRGARPQRLRLQRASKSGRRQASSRPQELSCSARKAGAAATALQNASGRGASPGRLPLRTSTSICGHACSSPPSFSNPLWPIPVSCKFRRRRKGFPDMTSQRTCTPASPMAFSARLRVLKPAPWSQACCRKPRRPSCAIFAA